MAMLRAHRRAGANVPMRLVYSVRTPADVYYAEELHAAEGADVTVLYTRVAPQGEARTPHRIDLDDLTEPERPAGERLTCYVCGPTPFVEAVADLLTRAGHDPARIRTERFGSSGG
jgi:ferredoxin-NADP reductase